MASIAMDRRRVLMGGLLLTAAVLFPIGAPAFAFSSSGNPISDMAYAINRNRGMAHSFANQLAMAAGAQSVGGSIWQRLLGRRPMKRLFWLANLAGVAYWIYSETPDSYSTDLPIDEGVNSTQFRPLGPVPEITVTSEAEYLVFRKNMDFNTVAVVRRAYLAGSPRSIELCRLARYRLPEVALGEDIAEVFPNTSAVPYRFSAKRYDDSHATSYSADDVIINGVRFFKGHASFRGDWNDNSLTKWRWVNGIPDQAPDTRPRPVLPDTIPADADLNPLRLAEDINEAIRRALEADPSLPRSDPVTEQEVRAVSPAGTPIQQVGTAKAVNTAPLPIPDPDNPNLPPGGGNPGSPENGDWSTPPKSVALPDDVGVPDFPQPDEVEERIGVAVCPELPGGITVHCGPLDSARPFLVNMGRLAGGVATFSMLIRD